MMTLISLVGVLLLAGSALAAITVLARRDEPLIPARSQLTVREALILPVAGWVLLVGPTVIARIMG